MLLVVKLQAFSLNVTLFNGWFSTFLNFTNGTKSRDASIKLVKIWYARWSIQLNSQNAIAVKNKDQKVIWDVSEALSFKLLTLMKQWEVYSAWWRYWNTLQIFLYRGLYTGGLYSGWEFRAYIPSYTVLLVMIGGVIFFWVIVTGELLIWEVNIYHYIRIDFRIVKNDWNELKLQKKKKKNSFAKNMQLKGRNVQKLWWTAVPQIFVPYVLPWT